jgi:hypothetical protein
MEKKLYDVPVEAKGKEKDEVLGKLGRDKITGFEGIITVVGSHLYGCNTLCLAPQMKDGKLEDSHSFDEGRIEIIGEGINASDVQSDKPGGEDWNPEERVS